MDNNEKCPICDEKLETRMFEDVTDHTQLVEMLVCVDCDYKVTIR